MKTTSTRECVNSVVLRSAKDIADKTIRFKYIGVSMIVVTLLYIVYLPKCYHDYYSECYDNGQETLEVPPRELKEKIMYRAQRTSPVQ